MLMDMNEQNADVPRVSAVALSGKTEVPSWFQ